MARSVARGYVTRLGDVTRSPLNGGFFLFAALACASAVSAQKPPANWDGMVASEEATPPDRATDQAPPTTRS